MRLPLSWLREHVALPPSLAPREIAAALVMLGVEVEEIDEVGADLVGPVLVGRVLEVEEFTASNGKTIRWCQVDVGEGPRGVICGARNFAVGDLVVVALPGAVLPGRFAITARKTYGHVSDGMICSARELGLGDEHSGIIVLPPDLAPIGTDAIELLHLRDVVLDLETTSDRGYEMSVRGIARELSHAFDAAYRDPADAVPVAAPDGAGWPVSTIT